MLLEEDVSLPRPIAVIPVGDENELKAIEIAYKLRKSGLRVEQAYSGNLKKRMMKANKINASKAVIIGSDELKENKVTIKDLSTGEQKSVMIENIVEELK